jgi:uncharacterized protein
MKIALFGATGNIGHRIAEEALRRGHAVTAITRSLEKPLALSHPQLSRAQGDAADAQSAARAMQGHDVAIASIAPSRDQAQGLVDITRALIQAVRTSGVSRLLFVGGAGSLEVAPGVQLVDTPQFPAFIKPIALAHRDALALLSQSDLDWTCLSPPIEIAPGERTGQFRLGKDQVLFDGQGRSRISMEDYAMALVDEAEKGAHRRTRFTLAY